MEHTCSQCGTAVGDGNPFCPNCHAPQIKVPVRPPTAPVTEPLTPGTPEDLQPPAEPVLLERGEDSNQDRDEEMSPEKLGPEEDEPAPERSVFQQTGYGAPGGAGAPPPQKLLRRPALHAAFLAGILAAVGTSIPVIPLAMLCMFASGGLAVTLYRRRAGQQPVTAWMGAKLGVLAGGLGFGLLALLSTVRLFAASERNALREAFRGKMQETIATATDPQVRHAMEQFRDSISTNQGLIVMVLIFLAVAAVFFLIFSALGGAMGAALFGHDGARGRS
jgi:hypothetical protein